MIFDNLLLLAHRRVLLNKTVGYKDSGAQTGSFVCDRDCSPNPPRTMAINTKNRRKLTHNGSEFIWWVAEDEVDYGRILHVLTHDKSFVAQYMLGQKDEERKLRAKAGGPHKWFRCPCFDPQGIVTPGSVTQLIDWCFAAHKNVVPYP